MEVYDRDKLYREVWEEPITKVSEKYKVSNIAIKKACEKLCIPTPGLGYWTKVKAGIAIEKPKLPEYDGPTVKRRTDDQDKLPKENIQNKVIVRDSLQNPSDLVKEADEQFKEYWKDHNNSDDYIHKLGKRFLDVSVSKSLASRALCIIDALINGLINEGYRVKVGVDGEYTCAIIDNEKIAFRIFEKNNRIILDRRMILGVSLASQILTPSGVLRLSIKSIDEPSLKKDWKDTEMHKLEDYLDRIIPAMKSIASQAKIKANERLIEDKIREEKKKKEREKEKEKQASLKTEEENRIKALEKAASNWQRAQVMRNYINALEASLGEIIEGERLSKTREYIEWARMKIDMLDPLVLKRDELLDGQSRQGDNLFEQPFISIMSMDMGYQLFDNIRVK